MATLYKILGQTSPADTNLDLCSPAQVGNSFVLSSIVAANTAATAKTFSIYAQQAAAIGESFESVTSQVLIPGTAKAFFVNDGVNLWAFTSSGDDLDFMHKSTDGGLSWTLISNYSSNLKYVGSAISSVRYTNGKYVIILQDARVSISSDAITWSNPTEVPFTGGGYLLSFIAPTPTSTLAISTDGQVMKSTNGTTWSTVSSNLTTIFSTTLNDFSWHTARSVTIMVNTEVFIMLSPAQDAFMADSTQRMVLKTSDDGATWVNTNITPALTPGSYPASYLRDIFYVNNKIIVIDSGLSNSITQTLINGKIIFSSDLGQTWSAPNLLPSVPNVYIAFSDVKYLDGKYYLLMGEEGGFSYGALYTSTDLQSILQINTDDIGINTASAQKIVSLVSNSMIIVGQAGTGYRSNLFTAPDTKRVIFNKVAIEGSSTAVLTMGITLGYGEKISVGERESLTSNSVTYTAFGSEVI